MFIPTFQTLKCSRILQYSVENGLKMDTIWSKNEFYYKDEVIKKDGKKAWKTKKHPAFDRVFNNWWLVLLINGGSGSVSSLKFHPLLP